MNKLAKLICGLGFPLSLMTACSTTPTAPAAPVLTPLSNTYWTLTTLKGKATRGPKNTSDVDIKFGATGEVNGFTGCGRYVGQSNAIDKNVKFSVRTSVAECGKNQKFEAAFLEVLASAKQYRITDSTLVLLDANNNELAQFTRR